MSDDLTPAQARVRDIADAINTHLMLNGQEWGIALLVNEEGFVVDGRVIELAALPAPEAPPAPSPYGVDNIPCPKCGGDRLMPDFTGSGYCHVGFPAESPRRGV